VGLANPEGELVLPSAKLVKNILNTFFADQDKIFEDFRVRENRQKFCKKLDSKLIDEINLPGNCNNIEDLMNAWYSGTQAIERKFESRMSAVNIHSIEERGTIEFRFFNGTLDTKKIESYLCFCSDFVQHSIHNDSAQSNVAEIPPISLVDSGQPSMQTD
jgi:hypothetical protein